jgi:hypothetical protein
MFCFTVYYSKMLIIFSLIIFKKRIKQQVFKIFFLITGDVTLVFLLLEVGSLFIFQSKKKRRKEKHSMFRILYFGYMQFQTSFWDVCTDSPMLYQGFSDEPQICHGHHTYYEISHKYVCFYINKLWAAKELTFKNFWDVEYWGVQKGTIE